MKQAQSGSQILAAAITKEASKQTYYTIRYFVDRRFVADAYRAYGYFRWVDDILDAQDDAEPRRNERGRSENLAFIHHQRALLEACYRGETWQELSPEEYMLVDLVRNDSGKNPGLRSYLWNMMAVMEFDAARRGQVITHGELTEYSRLLATAVTDAMHYFIGHDDPAPRHNGRYLAVTAAHITHMLRDTFEDIDGGYINIPGEYLQAHAITMHDVNVKAHQDWVRTRVALAHSYFAAGRESLAQVKSLRCRLAGYAYTARFEWILRAIVRDKYHLRPDYSNRKSLRAGLWMSWNLLTSIIASFWVHRNADALPFRSIEMKEL